MQLRAPRAWPPRTEARTRADVSCILSGLGPVKAKVQDGKLAAGTRRWCVVDPISTRRKMFCVTHRSANPGSSRPRNGEGRAVISTLPPSLAFACPVQNQFQISSTIPVFPRSRPVSFPSFLFVSLVPVPQAPSFLLSLHLSRSVSILLPHGFLPPIRSRVLGDMCGHICDMCGYEVMSLHFPPVSGWKICEGEPSEGEKKRDQKVLSLFGLITLE